MSFNENTRVKIPAILHLCRLGYTYVPLAGAKRNEDTNIFTDIFHESVKRINADTPVLDTKRLLTDISLSLENDDLGKAFYKLLTSASGTKLIDFKNFSNNSFHVVTELTYKNGEDEFRPDITLLINGMPLVFIEVKKPNNQDGILAERDRINIRFKNKKFKKFINISQILIFSNNMEYDSDSIEPIQGAFYSSTSLSSASFNCFREEQTLNLDSLLQPENDELENLVLKDTNLSAIKYAPEFSTNKSPSTPTNRMLTSLVSKERLAFFLQYGIAYVNEDHGIEKHIMRYPQFFASKAIQAKLDTGIKKGIIWHTQGSGKTALAYYNVHCLTDYFQKQNIIPKFYFIVDRIDLMEQAKGEFSKRGLSVHTVSSKGELLKDFRDRRSAFGLSGGREITVVNIQKFDDDPEQILENDYDINSQRVYFLDEVHRSYNPTGSFLANLFNSDKNAIMIGLTGTPLIQKNRKTTSIFGEYIHKYYYNASIADGYTLRLIREGIETNYKIQLEEALKEIEILKGNVDNKIIFAHQRFAEPMLDYIVQDFIKSRKLFNDNSIGGMVVCSSSEQAKMLFKIFLKKYNKEQKTVEDFDLTDFEVAEKPVIEYGSYQTEQKAPLTASLILYDIGSKDDKKTEITAFKEGKIDLLFVYNMLLTGFDAKRLKKLYINRVVKDQNLLQTLTRVNRPYKQFRYGYVVDFADIRSEFDKTNQAYFEELQNELGDEMQTYSDLLKSREEIEADISDIKEKLFEYDISNAEIFSQQVSAIEDKKTVLELKKALENAKNLYNLIRLYGHFDLLEKLDFKKLNLLYNETVRHLEMLNLKDSVHSDAASTNLLNAALEEIIFMFRKVSEEEMVIADELKEMLRKTRETMSGNFDPKDPEFITLYDELKRIFEKKKMDEVTQDEMKQNISILEKIYDKIKELNRKNNLLKLKYENDEKYVRIHKRILENRTVTSKESAIFETLQRIKQQTDERILNNMNVLENENYFSRLMQNMVYEEFEKEHIDLEPDTARFINNCIIKEYINEYKGA